MIRTTPQDITDPESDFDDQLEDETPEHELPDLINGVDETPAIYDPTSGNGSGVFEEDDENKIRKFHVNGVTVKVLAKRVQYYDADGKLVTESFQDYTRKTLLKDKDYASLDDFIRKWHSADRKQLIINELEQLGVLWDVLAEEVGKDLDPFDLLCHVVYGQQPLTRKERADNVRKRNYFTKYSGPAQNVLNTLLDKYADEGVQEIEDIQVLKLKPFDSLGRPLEMIKSSFGSKQAYEDAVNELESEIYQLPPRTA